jgi:uroporphyrinogen-III decarboxylase
MGAPTPLSPSTVVRRYSETIPFRERSETPEIAIELSLQPWRAFKPDGVIFFSDILTPLPAIGVEFDVVRGKVIRPLASETPSPPQLFKLSRSPIYGLNVPARSYGAQ